MKEKFKEFYASHKTAFWGGVIGLAVGLLIITVGFFKTLFLAICVFAGFFIGKLYNSDTEAGERLRKFFSFRGGDK